MIYGQEKRARDYSNEIDYENDAQIEGQTFSDLYDSFKSYCVPSYNRKNIKIKEKKRLSEKIEDKLR